MDPKRVVVGYFGPMSGKRTNAAEETAKALDAMREGGELALPADAELTFLPLDRTARDVDAFVAAAKAQGAGKVVILGESLGPLKVETVAYDRGTPPENVFVSALSGFARHGRGAPLTTSAPVTEMAQAAGATVSTDAGTDYCNFAFHKALAAGLPAVFVHVNSGLFEAFRDVPGSAAGVAAMLQAWFLASESAGRG